MLNIPARIIDPHSPHFGDIVRILAVQHDFSGRVTSYLCQSPKIGELELRTWDVQRHFRAALTTQLELFHD